MKHVDAGIVPADYDAIRCKYCGNESKLIRLVEVYTCDQVEIERLLTEGFDQWAEEEYMYSPPTRRIVHHKKIQNE